MALYIPHSILHLARLLYVRPEILDPTTYLLLRYKDSVVKNQEKSQKLCISSVYSEGTNVTHIKTTHEHKLYTFINYKLRCSVRREEEKVSALNSGTHPPNSFFSQCCQRQKLHLIIIVTSSSTNLAGPWFVQYSTPLFSVFGSSSAVPNTTTTTTHVHPHTIQTQQFWSPCRPLS